MGTLGRAEVLRLFCSRRVDEVPAMNASGLPGIDSYVFYNAPAFSITIASMSPAGVKPNTCA